MSRRPLAHMLSASTTELPAAAAPAAAVDPPGGVQRGWPISPGRFYAGLVVTALIVGALSLLIPSTPSYDPWAWITWGREIVHINLQTTGGPTWKPLPVIFTTLFAPFGQAAPDLWLVVARAGAFAAVVMVFRLSVRLTRQIGSCFSSAPGDLDWLSSLGPGVLAGVIAVLGLAFSGGFISDNALGYSEGVATAAILIAVERHLDGQPRQTFAIGFLAALDRPEIWLFWGPYGLYLWWRDPGARKLVIGLFVLIPVLWFLPEYWGSGHFLRGVNRAQRPRSNSNAFARCPFCAELIRSAWPTILLRIKVAAAVLVAVVALLLWRGWRPHGRASLARSQARGQLAAAGVGIAGLSWFVVIAVMTQIGFSGNNRYLIIGSALVEICGAVAWGWGAQELGNLIRARWPDHQPAGREGSAPAESQASAPAESQASPPAESGPSPPVESQASPPVESKASPPVEGAAPARTGRAGPARASSWLGVAIVALAFAMLPSWVGGNLIDLQRTHRALVYQAHLRQGAAKIVRDYGGAAKLLRCGSVMTEGFQVPLVAWTLGVHTLRVGAPAARGVPPGAAPNVILQTRATRRAALLPLVRTWPTVHYVYAGHNGPFRLFTHCRG